MTILNQTTANLNISGTILSPNESIEHSEMMFDSLHIHSNIGSCIITTEYGKRSFHNYGNLIAKEGHEKNAHGMKNIIISSI